MKSQRLLPMTCILLCGAGLARAASSGAQSAQDLSAEELRQEWAKSEVFEGECRWDIELPLTSLPAPGSQIAVLHKGKPLLQSARVISVQKNERKVTED